MAKTASPISRITDRTPLAPALNAWEFYLDDQGRSIHTIKAFIADVALLADYLPPDRTIGAISTNDLNKFLEWMQHGRGVPCSPKTLSRRITSLKSFFRWLQQNGVILADPAERVVQRSVLSPIPYVLSSKEMQAALKVANRYRRGEKPDARPYTLLALLLETGIKKGECLALSPNHVDRDAEGGAILFVRYGSPQHRYKERKILLPDYWLEAYDEYAAQYKLKDKLFPWSQRRLEYLLEDIGKEAGLPNQLSFLMCRWTCALNDLESGMDPNKLRQKLGISEIQWREIKMKLDRLARGDSAD